MNDAASANAFEAGLLAERDAAEKFVDLLREEQAALVSGAVDELDALTRRKACVADELSQHGRSRETRLAAMGYAADVHGMRAWVDAQRGRPESVTLWKSLHALAGQARALNETNGILIEMRLRNCEQSLAALADACGRPTLYGRHGHAIAPADGSTSIRA